MSKLYVNEIYAKGSSTKALEIDSSGRILMPARPSFHVRLDTATSGQNYTSMSDCPFDTIDHEVGDCIAISSDVATFTAPIAGVYHFSLTVGFDAVGSATWLSTFLFLNGATVNGSDEESYRVLTDVPSADYVALTSSNTIQLASGDTINPKIKVNTDTSVGIRVSTRFSGFLVG